MSRHPLGSVLAAAGLALSVTVALAPSAAAITPGEALTTGAVGGYSTGSVIAAELVTGDPGTLTNISIAQSAADAAVGRELVDEDLLNNAILFADDAARAGKNAYGHGSAANVGVGQAENEVPQVAPAVSEALSPPPTVAEPGGGALPEQLAPVVEASLLATTAQARTTSVDSICPDGEAGGLISEGTAEAANASLLNVIPPTAPETENGSVLATGGVVRSESQTLLEGTSLVTVTTQSIAPITLFEGTGAELNIEVVHLLQLRALATGGEGSELFYGFVDAETGERVPDSEPVVFVNGEGLTTEQVLGTDGLQLGLGVADVIIGGPAHGLDDDPTSDPTVTPTTVAGAADLIRVTVPGVLPVPATDPIAADSPLADLNQVLNPIIEGIAPITEQIQAGLTDAGVTAADIRVGHLEALAVVPEGGVVCTAAGPEDPLQAAKDSSTNSVAPGGTFPYTVRFQNDGTEPMTDVRVVDTFSPGLEFVSGTGSVTTSAADVRELTIPAPQGNTLTIDVGTLQPGAFVDIRLTFRAPDDAANGTVYRNQATITATYQGEQITEEVAAEGPTVTDTFSGDCNVQRSTKYASHEQVRTGQQFAYFVNVSNTGSEPCTNVTITDDLGPGVEFVSCSDDCTVEGKRVTTRLGTLAGGSTTTASIVVRATATEGTLPNEAIIQTSEGSTARPSTPGPSVTDVSVVAAGNPAGCPATGCPQARRVSPVNNRLADTGLTGVAPALGLLALMGGAVAMRRRGDAA